MTETTRERIGDYEILEYINRGGMGEVLLARQRGVHGFEKLVAIKVICTNMSSFADLRTMFLDEARLLARLNHPIITQVYDFGEDAERLYLVMEYVPGITFVQLVKMRPPPLVAARAVAEVCRGLHAAHQLKDITGRALGVVHRDVSPQNLMLNFDGRVKILDFGIALMRDRETQGTQFGQIKGKPGYMAPEQLRAKLLDARTDVFAAAIVLYELLCGQRPFAGDNIVTIAEAMEQDIVAPSRLMPQIPAGLDAIVLKALESDPDRRFQSAAEMADALQKLATNLGSESLESYTLRALEVERKQHQKRLVLLHSDQHPDPVSARPDGVGTVPLTFVHITDVPKDNAVLDTLLKTRPVQSGKKVALSQLLLRPAFAWTLAAVFILAAAWLTWMFEYSPSLGPQQAQPFGARPDEQQLADAGAKPGLELSYVALNALQGDAAVVADASAVSVVERNGNPKTRRTHVGQSKGPRALSKALAKPQSKAQPKAGSEKTEQSKVEQKFGYLTVAAEPYADVRIDGKQVGTTLLFRHKLAEGWHDVALFSPDTGQLRKRKRLFIEADRLQRIIVRGEGQTR